MAAIYWGLCGKRQAREIAEAVLVTKTWPFTVAEPFGTMVTLRALDKIGSMDLAYRILKERWGAWMVDKGFTSTTEEWGANGSFRSGSYQGIMRSLSHAWSAGPAQFMIHHTIGLQIVTPGCGRIRLHPADIGTDYHIVCPLPQGDLTVESRGKKVTYAAPDGVEVEMT